MSTTYGMPYCTRLALATGVHQPGDTYAVALYTTDATLNSHTECYTKECEVQGQGYVAGGKVLTGYKAALHGARAEVGFASPVVWKNATIKARSAMIYNKSKGNCAVTILDLGQETSSTNGEWLMDLPDAVIWIG